MTTRLFDLNIEEVLEHWQAPHAVREIISNALDEQSLTRTREIDIFEGPDGWHIRDFGRGLRIEHFTLSENKEKLAPAADVIGKFGVGLKDALATFHRHGVGVTIRSRHGTFRLRQERKHNFADILTLHIDHDDTPAKAVGTEVVLHGLHARDMAEARGLFLRFSGERVLETTAFGQVLDPSGRPPRVYISGVVANDEPGFLFSYNITSLTEAMRKRLSRERVNLGRTAYVDRVKAILKAADAPQVQDRLADQALHRSRGEQCDEMQWIEISQAALNLLHGRRQVAYVTSEEIVAHPHLVDAIQRDGREVVTITDHERTKLQSQVALGGPTVTTLDTFVQTFNQSFQYAFLETADLHADERRVFGLTAHILALIEPDTRRHPTVRVSEVLRVTTDRTCGVWDSAIQSIVIRRDQLRTVSDYAGTLLHEAAHAFSGAPDVSREFESALTDYLGRIAALVLAPSHATLVAQSTPLDTEALRGSAYGPLNDRNTPPGAPVVGVPPNVQAPPHAVVTGSERPSTAAVSEADILVEVRRVRELRGWLLTLTLARSRARFLLRESVTIEGALEYLFKAICEYKNAQRRAEYAAMSFDIPQRSQAVNRSLDHPFRGESPDEAADRLRSLVGPTLYVHLLGKYAESACSPAP